MAWILDELFVPPLDRPRFQVTTEDGLDRRDIVFANNATVGIWGYLIARYRADVVIVEAKNGQDDLAKGDVVQLRDYLLRKGSGDFGILAGRKQVSVNAMEQSIRSLADTHKMIISIVDRDLERMCWLKTVGEDPSVVLQEKRLDLQLKV